MLFPTDVFGHRQKKENLICLFESQRSHCFFGFFSLLVQKIVKEVAMVRLTTETGRRKKNKTHVSYSCTQKINRDRKHVHPLNPPPHSSKMEGLAHMHPRTILFFQTYRDISVGHNHRNVPEWTPAWQLYLDRSL